GAAETGPIPDTALLLRIDAFQAEPRPDAAGVPVRIALAATLVRDADQSLRAARDFTATATAPSDTPATLIPAFQQALASILPTLADWAADRA
ncbi:MAG: hypothetical protein AAF366_16135, partial [Pseudomonadota bacterium]